MKLLLLSLLLIYLSSETESNENQVYTTKYDNVNLDEILCNDRLLDGYVNCLLDFGSCTPDGKELKKNLPDAVENDCRKCTEKQREGANKVMHYIIDHRPDDWKKLENKYNSDGSYKKKYLINKISGKSKTDDTETNCEEDT